MFRTWLAGLGKYARLLYGIVGAYTVDAREMSFPGVVRHETLSFTRDGDRYSPATQFSDQVMAAQEPDSSTFIFQHSPVNRAPKQYSISVTVNSDDLYNSRVFSLIGAYVGNTGAPHIAWFDYAEATINFSPRPNRHRCLDMSIQPDKPHVILIELATLGADCGRTGSVLETVNMALDIVESVADNVYAYCETRHIRLPRLEIIDVDWPEEVRRALRSRGFTKTQDAVWQRRLRVVSTSTRRMRKPRAYKHWDADIEEALRAELDETQEAVRDPTSLESKLEDALNAADLSAEETLFASRLEQELRDARA